MLAELKECFLEAYDDNQDGKIDIREVSWLTETDCHISFKAAHSFAVKLDALSQSAPSWIILLSIKGASRYDVCIRGGGGSWKSRQSKGGCVNFIP